MKNKFNSQRFLISIAISTTLLLMAFTYLSSNAFMLLTDRSNFIPTESSILHFDPYSINQGSGNYWLYGKDKTFYYHFLYDTETPYLFISTSNSCQDFDKNNFKTWCSAQKGNVD